MLFSLGFRNMIYSNYPQTNNFQFNTPKIKVRPTPTRAYNMPRPRPFKI